jgi:cation transport regulator
MGKDYCIMPYNKKRDLPSNVRDNLPTHAQEILMNAFNNAWEEYKDPEKRTGDACREETANRVAWSAVKKEYEKDNNGNWTKK